MGAWLFRHRLAVMTTAFLAGLGCAVLAARVGVEGGWWLRPVWLLDGEKGLPRVTFAWTGLMCVSAFFLRSWAEAHLGEAVYGQGRTDGLVHSGPFRHLRNPLYVGTWTFFAAAVALWAPALAWLTLCVAFGAVLHAMVLHEEKFLVDALGAPYAEFLRTTPRWWPRLQTGERDPSASAAAWWRAVVGNVGMLSLGLYRLVVATGLPGDVPGLVNGVIILAWLAVLLARRHARRG